MLPVMLPVAILAARAAISAAIVPLALLAGWILLVGAAWALVALAGQSDAEAPAPPRPEPAPAPERASAPEPAPEEYIAL